MALTYAQLKLHAQHAAAIDSSTLPPGTTSDLAAGQIVNQAGRYMFKEPWNFRIAPPAILAFIAPISIANGTWTQSTLSLSKTSGFTNYTFAKGDIFKVTDGTGATAGSYTIASRTSNDAIVLAVTIGTSADGQTDIDGTIYFPYVNLPSDFGDMVWLEMNSTYSCVQLSSPDEVMRRRFASVSINSNDYMGYVVHPGQTAATAEFSTPRIELDHAPTAVDPDAMFCVYRRKWTTLATDAHYPNLPEYAEDLLIEYVRAFADGYMNRHADNDGIVPVVTINDRIADIKNGNIWRDTKEYDGLVQSDYGYIGHGPAGYPSDVASWRSRTSGAVSDPA